MEEKEEHGLLLTHYLILVASSRRSEEESPSLMDSKAGFSCPWLVAAPRQITSRAEISWSGDALQCAFSWGIRRVQDGLESRVFGQRKVGTLQPQYDRSHRVYRAHAEERGEETAGVGGTAHFLPATLQVGELHEAREKS